MATPPVAGSTLPAGGWDGSALSATPDTGVTLVGVPWHVPTHVVVGSGVSTHVHAAAAGGPAVRGVWPSRSARTRARRDEPIGVACWARGAWPATRTGAMASPPDHAMPAWPGVAVSRDTGVGGCDTAWRVPVRRHPLPPVDGVVATWACTQRTRADDGPSSADCGVPACIVACAGVDTAGAGGGRRERAVAGVLRPCTVCTRVGVACEQDIPLMLCHHTRRIRTSSSCTRLRKRWFSASSSRIRLTKRCTSCVWHTEEPSDLRRVGEGREWSGTA